MTTSEPEKGHSCQSSSQSTRSHIPDRCDHSYAVSKTKVAPVQKSSEGVEKGINAVKDLKKKHELLKRRFKTKIEEDNNFRCRNCSAEFPTKIKAELHVKNPSCYPKKRKRKLKFKKCHEKDCGLEFELAKDLKKHRLEAHNSHYTCPDCQMGFNTKGNFTRHVLNCKETNKKFKCEQCPFSSSQKSNLQSHVKSQHKVGHKIFFTSQTSVSVWVCVSDFSFFLIFCCCLLLLRFSSCLF